MKTYEKLGYRDIVMIETLLNQKMKKIEIAMKLSRNKSTISRCINDYSDEDGTFEVDRVWEKIKENRRNRKGHRKILSDELLKKYVLEKIEINWSPEQISEILRIKAKGKCVISTETIYQFVYLKEGKNLKFWKHLRHRKKPKRQSWSERRKYKARARIPERQHISLRSPAANLRTEPGHFEVDLMIFSHTKKVLAVFVDRCTRKTWAYFNPDKTASAMADTLREFVCDAGICNVKSLSFDNGTENFYHHIVRDEFGTFETFFCDPYCSWQKGTVENTNKLLRQYFPRNLNPFLFNDGNLLFALNRLNNRPRKCLNFLTPNFCSV